MWNKVLLKQFDLKFPKPGTVKNSNNPPVAWSKTVKNILGSIAEPEKFNLTQWMIARQQHYLLVRRTSLFANTFV